MVKMPYLSYFILVLLLHSPDHFVTLFRVKNEFNKDSSGNEAFLQDKTDPNKMFTSEPTPDKTFPMDKQNLAKRGLHLLFTWDPIDRLRGKMHAFRHTRKVRSEQKRTRDPSWSNAEYMDERRNEDLHIAQTKNIAVIPTVNGEFIDKRGKRRTRNEWPIVYSKNYNVRLGGLEKLHPFDVQKWKNIISYLKKENMLSYKTISVPDEADRKLLRLVHSKEYLDSLKSGLTIAQITDLSLFAIIRSSTIDKRYLKPMRFQVGGSILAAELAIHRGWAVNIGGGFHHASANHGEGFCPYADITLIIIWLFKHYPDHVKTAMIVDLDAHQGNGHEYDFYHDFEDRIFIMDFYNRNCIPEHTRGPGAIDCGMELESHTTDEDYLYFVETHLETSLQSFHPDILIYNAGTDILKGDPLGYQDVSAQGIIDRDEIVFTKARKFGVPIVMLTSGGYLKKTARIIAKSILNLKERGLIPK